MEVHQLAYFESVSRHLHFTRAAEELNVAQPSVSQQIRKLEAELGTPLFHRMKRNVALTEAGTLFLRHARAVLQQLDEARVEVQELTGLRKGSLAVGAPPSVGTHLFPRALAAFSSRHPGISAHLSRGRLAHAGATARGRRAGPGGRDPADSAPRPGDAAAAGGRAPAGACRARTRWPRAAVGCAWCSCATSRSCCCARARTTCATRRCWPAVGRASSRAWPSMAGRWTASCASSPPGIGLAILPGMVVADLDPHAGAVSVRPLRPRLIRSLVLARRRDRYFSAAAQEFNRILHAAARRDVPAA